MVTFAFKVAISVGRVVFRGYNNANANGGVANANANNDSSNTNTNVGSRLENNRIKNNRCTAGGTCSHSGAEEVKPQQQRQQCRKAEK